MCVRVYNLSIFYQTHSFIINNSCVCVFCCASFFIVRFFVISPCAYDIIIVLCPHTHCVALHRLAQQRVVTVFFANIHDTTNHTRMFKKIKEKKTHNKTKKNTSRIHKCIHKTHNIRRAELMSVDFQGDRSFRRSFRTFSTNIFTNCLCDVRDV